ncbi:MAG: aminotransferase class V-fold PLP-dependent enzyme [Planctomycetota bacterium]|nr:aminotransferase class V-fold PLP-dependent enzyme [Planctomycetota bacterium]
MSEPNARSSSATSSTDARHAFETRAVHAGWTPDAETGAVMPPICMTSTYVQDAPGKPRNGFEYSRTQNVTRFALQDALADLEGAAAGFTFASGMAAVHTLMLTLKPGDHVVAGNDLYGGTHRLFTKIAARFGLKFTFIDSTNPEELNNLPQDTRLLYLESPSNPLLNITSLEAAVKAAKKVGAQVAVDNTFASPALQNPIDFGVDFILHSTTKYIGGHSDVVGGAILIREESQKEDLWFHQNSAGTVNSPFDAFLTLRGLRTLPLRMERHCQNAEALAEYLEHHPKVERTIYPGLATHPGHSIAKEQMHGGFGGMLCFELPGGIQQTTELVKHLEIYALAESLGGVESLIELPAPMTHASIPPEKRQAIGIADGLVRLSVGIENVDDLLADLEQALQKV